MRISDKINTLSYFKRFWDHRPDLMAGIGATMTRLLSAVPMTGKRINYFKINDKPA